jgi:uncharacterized protein YdhG (YjbR/CyaY superfamily)
VDAYLAALPPAERNALKRIRKAIKSAAPFAQEGISYGIPAYKYHGPLVFFASFQKHLGFYGVNKALIHKFGANLKNCNVSGSTIRFTPKNPIPIDIVRRIVIARVEQNEERLIVRRKN